MSFHRANFIATVALVVLVAMVKAAPQGYQSSCEDRMPHLCSGELQAHYCYLEHNRNLCCRTCAQHRTGDRDCPYGDHYTNILRRDANGVETTYDCPGYIGFYGRHHCSEPNFRSYCCKSCRP